MAGTAITPAGRSRPAQSRSTMPAGESRSAWRRRRPEDLGWHGIGCVVVRRGRGQEQRRPADRIAADTVEVYNAGRQIAASTAKDVLSLIEILTLCKTSTETRNWLTILLSYLLSQSHRQGHRCVQVRDPSVGYGVVQ